MKANTRVTLIVLVILPIAILAYMLSRSPLDDRSTTTPTKQSSPASIVQYATPLVELIPSPTPISRPTDSFPTPRPLPTKTPILTPAPTFYATLYPFSFDSTEGWTVYTDTERKISFMYPAESPFAGYDQRESRYHITIQARVDAFHPAGIAEVGIEIYEKIPEDLSLDDFITQSPWGRLTKSDDQHLLALAESLKQHGSEESLAYLNGFEIPSAAALYRRRVYIFSQGIQTFGAAQQQIFQVFVSSARFLP